MTVGLCVDHPNKSYAHTAGTTEHTWTCTVCKAEEPEMCTFPFDENGIGSCVCGNGSWTRTTWPIWSMTAR